MKELMERSFSFRRIEIVDDSLSLEEIFDKFPFLQEIDMVNNLFATSMGVNYNVFIFSL